MSKYCKTDKSADDKEAKFKCGKCGRLAKKEEKLCKPKRKGKG